MGSRITCFFLVPGVTAEESYRRYSRGGVDCPAHRGGYHNAFVVVGEVRWDESYHGCGGTPSDEAKQDPRWPAACDCGYVFQPADAWQHNFKRHFEDVQRVRLKTTLEAAPPGAMWDADWMPESHKGEDGRALCVRLPDGVDWLIDGPSRGLGSAQGPGWRRTGTPPFVTARPSILTDGYHGFLTDGVLEEC